VTPDVLVPRPETELLVEWALGSLPAGPRRQLAVDLGTGSGAIACALAQARPSLDVLAVDVSEAAGRVARDNVLRLGLGDRVRVVVGDLDAALRPRRADLVVANPPYLPSATVHACSPEVRVHEPRLALDGGPDGLELVRRIVSAAPTLLVPGGRLWLETAGPEQVAAVRRWLERAAPEWSDIRVRADLAGCLRFVGAAWAGVTEVPRGGIGRGAKPPSEG
jgi:release factor glutamine methyltransferase